MQSGLAGDMTSKNLRWTRILYVVRLASVFTELVIRNSPFGIPYSFSRSLTNSYKSSAVFASSSFSLNFSSSINLLILARA